MITPSGVATVHLVMVGSEDGIGGAPVAVIPDASAIPIAARQVLAARVGVDETVFIDGATGDLLTIAAFRPSRRVQGHRGAENGYIAAAWLHWAGQRAPLRPVRCRTPTGIVAIGLSADGVLCLRFPASGFQPAERTPSLGAVVDLLFEGGEPAADALVASDNGSRYLLAAVDGAEQLAAIDGGRSILADYAAEAGLAGIYAYHSATDTSEARLFGSGAAAPMPAVAALAQRIHATHPDGLGPEAVSVRHHRASGQQGGCLLRADVRTDPDSGAPVAVDVGGYCHHAGTTSFSW